MLASVVDARFGESLPLDSSETAVVLQSLFQLASAKQLLFPATLPGTKVTTATLQELLPELPSYVFSIVPGRARRVLLLCINFNVYLVTPRLYVTNVTRFFPAHFASELTNLSLLDGELVGSHRFIVSDALAIRGASCRPLKLARRLELCQKAFGPHLTSLPSWYPASESESFALLGSGGGKGGGAGGGAGGGERVEVVLQRYFEVSQFGAAMGRVQQEAEWSGCVKFVPREEHYKLGLNKMVFMWRPIDCIFVDFAVRRLEPSKDAPHRSDFQLLKEDSKGQLLLHDYVSDVDKHWPVWDGCVAECFWDPAGKTFVVGADGQSFEYRGGWQVVRLRYDRLESNPSWIVAKLIAEIDNTVSLSDLAAVLRGEKLPVKEAPAPTLAAPASTGEGGGSRGGRGGNRQGHHNSNNNSSSNGNGNGGGGRKKGGNGSGYSNGRRRGGSKTAAKK